MNSPLRAMLLPKFVFCWMILLLMNSTPVQAADSAAANCDEVACDEPETESCDEEESEEGCDAEDEEESECDCEAWLVDRESLFCDECWNLDCVTERLNLEHCNFSMPISGGAWHWFHQSLINRGGGYGIPGLRNTYFWYLFADPVYDPGCGRSIGGHVELRLRETGPFRTFIDQTAWTWEAYGYIQDDDWGMLKAGQVYKQFGIFWDGVFFGNAPYFDGFKLDADYGLSWEKTTEVHDCFKVQSYGQFFFHEDQSNGSFGGADAESVIGYTEKNTAVGRVVPTWTGTDGSVIELGISGLVGQIDSRVANLADQDTAAYGVDLTYTRGPWKIFAEGMQHFGIFNPTRYVSGGPSNRITNFLGGVHYTRGPVTYRCSYSNSLDANPDGRQNMVLAGATITLTRNIDLYVEYVYERIDGNRNAASNGDVFNSIEYVVNWHF